MAIGGPFLLMMTGVAFTVGALTNVWFQQTSGQIAVTAAGGNVDAIIPLYINQAMPDLFIVVFMLTLLAAAMSTLASLFHAMGSALVCDVWSRGRACAHSVRANQVGCVVMMVLSVGLAFLMPESIIARATAMFMGLCASAFLPIFAVAVLTERPDPVAAKASFVAGALAAYRAAFPLSLRPDSAVRSRWTRFGEGRAPHIRPRKPRPVRAVGLPGTIWSPDEEEPLRGIRSRSARLAAPGAEPGP